ncbi:DUF4304 domain-containing protein [Luteipulveratus halotolerans]|uniref:DUF4304 domain-containing protein n=1 Tax=Luteipulveratus halotolerans TaxID=1631356 RepID=A0A0L6CH20_9MICO|nr:DUF4304 domain-containing protein [Luteipulveratus halotolerans]KNX37102.1 hypothetical protein VV01_08010 [Luteipulveratus halotolerans]
MTAQKALRLAVRDVFGPNARAHGFKGAFPTWRRSTPAGDWAVVHIQTSMWNTSSELECIVNLAVAPEPWIRWWRDFDNEITGDVSRIHEDAGLYRTRLQPTGTSAEFERWWRVTDEVSATDAVQDMVRQLEQTGWPLLDALLSPGGCLAAVEQGDLGDLRYEDFPSHFLRARAMLIVDCGPSPELDRLLSAALLFAGSEESAMAQEFDRWARRQAQQAT